MVQIKLSISFVLAAAAIAPAIARPHGKGAHQELNQNNQLHQHGATHHQSHPQHQPKEQPPQDALAPADAPPSRREYVDMLEARDRSSYGQTTGSHKHQRNGRINPLHQRNGQPETNPHPKRRQPLAPQDASADAPPSRREYVVELEARNHEHHHGHKHRASDNQVPPQPQQQPAQDALPVAADAPPSRREYVVELEARNYDHKHMHHGHKHRRKRVHGRKPQDSQVAPQPQQQPPQDAPAADASSPPPSRREYADDLKVREFVDMFKRDFEDLQFDARDFDELYLD